MTPEIIGTENNISFMDTMLSRDTQAERDPAMKMDYEKVSNERQNNLANDSEVSEQGVEARTQAKPEKDPVKVHETARKVVEKVKKLVKGEEVEPIDEADLEELGELYFLLLNIIETRISDQVETATHEIAHIDLKAEGAVEAILAHADLLDATKDLGIKVEELAKQLLPIDQIAEEVEIQIEPELVAEVHIQVDALIKDYQQEVSQGLEVEVQTGADSSLVELRDEVYKDLGLLPETEEVETVAVNEEIVTQDAKRTVDPLEVRIRFDYGALKPEENAEGQEAKLNYGPAKPETKSIDIQSEIKPEELEVEAELDLTQVETNEVKIDTDKDVEADITDSDAGELRIDTTKRKPDIQDNKRGEIENEVEILDNDSETVFEDLLGDGALGDSSGEEAAALSNKQNIQTNLVNRAVKFDTVKPVDIGTYLQEQVTELPKNSKQEVKLQLNPETLGKIDLTITKNERNEVSIRMLFHDGNSLNNMKTNLKDSLIELKSALRDNNLDLSKFEVGQSKSSSTAYDGQQGSESFTQTEDEQHQRLLNRQPEWLRAADSINQASFAELADGIEREEV